MTRGALHLRGMGGLGDNLYLRPAVAAMLSDYRPIYLDTPWPELWADMPEVRPVRWYTNHRCADESAARWEGQWWAAPEGRPRNLRYALANSAESVVDELARNSGRPELRTHYPMSAPSQLSPDGFWYVPDGPYALVRPPTIRKEWRNFARAPEPGLFPLACRMLRAAGFRVVLIGHLADGEEWLIDPAEELVADDTHLHGQLTLRNVMALTEAASVVVCSPGFLLPLAMAYSRPCVCIAGGNGRHNAPQYITPAAIPASAFVSWVTPQPMCMCVARTHNCAKSIPDFVPRFGAAVDLAIGARGDSRTEPTGLLAEVP